MTDTFDPSRRPQAIDLSPEQAQLNAEKAFEIVERIKSSIRTGRQAAWELAEGLYEFHEMSGWHALGYEGVSEFLADPEISLKSVTYYRAVERWRYFGVRRGLPLSTLTELDPSKVDIVARSVKQGEVAWSKAETDVKSMGARDLREEYFGRHEAIPIEPSSNGDIDGKAIELLEDPSEESEIESPETPETKEVYKDDRLAEAHALIGERSQQAIDLLREVYEDEKAFGRLPTKYRMRIEQFFGELE